MNKRGFIRDLEKHVKQFYKGNLHHGWAHLNRVRNYAVHIAKEEGANEFVAEVAALLHDIGKIKHGPTLKNHAARGAGMARRLLKKKGLSRDLVDEVCSCINAHSRKEPPMPKTLNEKVLYDADGLEMIGAVGMMRTALYAAYYDKSWKDMLKKARTRLGKIKFSTKTGNRIARKRVRLVERFYEELELELNWKK